MKHIKDISNKIGGYSCILVVVLFWSDRLLNSIVLKVEPFRYSPFDFLEQVTPLDPIDIVNIFFSIYKFILCVILY